MTLTMHPYQSEEDYWRMRNFLRTVFLLNDRLERSWNVARLDYWRWHFVTNLQVCESVEQGVAMWEREDGEIAGFVNTLGDGEIRLHLHPNNRSAPLLEAMLAHAEEHFCSFDGDQRNIYLPVEAGDRLLQDSLSKGGYVKGTGISHHWRRDLHSPLPTVPLASGYVVRSMGAADEHPARSWASWRSFHSDEPEGNYDGDFTWFGNLQSAPLYRRDLDIVAATSQDEIASFCTIFYDDYTRSAVCVLVGTAAEHWRRGLGKAVMTEGLRRLKQMGCTRVFATAYDPPADALYGSVLQDHLVVETWLKRW